MYASWKPCCVLCTIPSGMLSAADAANTKSAGAVSDTAGGELTCKIAAQGIHAHTPADTAAATSPIASSI